jgi:hypothetical protein
VIVRLPDGLQLAIPEWMLKPEMSERVTSEATPRIAIGALTELRRCIDAQSLMKAGAELPSGAQSAGGGADAQQREPDGVATETSLRRRRGLGDASRAGAGTLSRAVGSAPGKRSQRERTEAE